jgi:hypothetical protein
VVTVEAEGIHGPRLGFHRVPEPKSVKNRLHLDLITTEFDAETSVCSVWAPGASKTWNRAAPAGRRSPTSRATNSTSSRAELS